ncbi:hypothetical protein ABZ345_20735 [Lentzea sp. NPDC005914]|uniref:hypothetical protein n=1 Tax=Lentzea sp. NPDC005914 TaxID=3154572 RepID=UPI0033DA8BAC
MLVVPAHPAHAARLLGEDLAGREVGVVGGFATRIRSTPSSNASITELVRISISRRSGPITDTSRTLTYFASDGSSLSTRAIARPRSIAASCQIPSSAAARSTHRPRGRLSPRLPVNVPGASFRISSSAATAASDSGRSGRLRPRRQ